MNRIAIIGIILENNTASENINRILHEYNQYIIGRMGLPHVRENINVINIVIDAPADIINTVSGKLGRLKDVSSKTIYSKE